MFYPLRQTSSTKRYEGGEQSRLWRWCAGDDEAKMLTPEKLDQTRGSWSPWRVAISERFFLEDKSGVANLWVMNLDGTNKKRLTHECGMDIMEVSIDGEVGVARIGGELRRFQLQGRRRAAGGFRRRCASRSSPSSASSPQKASISARGTARGGAFG